MKSWLTLAACGAVLLLEASHAVFSAETREQRELAMAEKSIMGELAVSASPKGRALCTNDPLACVGANKAELGLALIGARGTSTSVAVLVRLMRFHMDGALSEDYDCYLLKYGGLSRTYLKRLKPAELEKECQSDLTELMANDRQSFAGIDSRGVCSSQEQIRQRINEAVSAIDAGRHCKDEDF
jgi:Immunity protein 57